MPDDYNAADMREYLDREAIRDILARYAHAIDRLDAKLLESVYWPDGIDDHGVFKGTRDEFVTWVIPVLRQSIAISQHFLGNMLIRIDGNTASVETYFQAYHRWVHDDGSQPTDVIHGGRYLDRMEKRGKEWRIKYRIAAFDYLREWPDSNNWDDNARHMRTPEHRGAHSPNDPSSPMFGPSLARSPF
jgi:hypothetical protein